MFIACFADLFLSMADFQNDVMLYFLAYALRDFYFRYCTTNSFDIVHKNLAVLPLPPTNNYSLPIMYVKQKILFSFISSFGPISRSFLYMLSFNCIYLLRFCIHGSFCLSVLFLLPFLYYPLLFTFCSRV